MAKRKPGTVDTITIANVVYVGLRQWCRGHGMEKRDERYVCTTARNETEPADVGGGVVSVSLPPARTTFGGRWIMPRDATADVIPVRGENAIVRRADGRIRFVIYLTDTEFVELSPRFDVVDLREKRRERRARKRANADTADG